MKTMKAKVTQADPLLAELIPPISPEKGPLDDFKKWMKEHPKSRIVAVDGQEVLGEHEFSGVNEHGKQVVFRQLEYKIKVGDTINIELIEKPEYADFEKYRHSYIVQTITDIEGYDQALTRWETYKWKIA